MFKYFCLGLGFVYSGVLFYYAFTGLGWNGEVALYAVVFFSCYNIGSLEERIKKLEYLNKTRL